MDPTDTTQTLRVALLFEGGLGLLAIGVGWLVGHSPLVGISGEAIDLPTQVRAIGWGLVATGPLLLALLTIEQFPIGPLRQLREMTAEIILRMFGGATIGQLAAISLAAGCGEELLFRGLIQAGVSSWITGPVGIGVGLALASLFFGICHWLSGTYAILAVLAGAYFGLLLILSDNILAPIIAHAAYDFLALVYLIKPQHLIGSE